MNTKPEPGSKAEKLVKLFKAMRSITDLAPWGGGLSADPELRRIWDELNSRFLIQAELCGMEEQDALRYADLHS